MKNDYYLTTKHQFLMKLRRDGKLKEVRAEQKREYKKIRRRIWWEVYYYDPEQNGKLTERDFVSSKRARKFVFHLYRTYGLENLSLEVVKVFGYREHSPRHMTFYYNFQPPDKFIKCLSDSY
jgi:hypothetical protein